METETYFQKSFLFSIYTKWAPRKIDFRIFKDRKKRNISCTEYQLLPTVTNIRNMQTQNCKSLVPCKDECNNIPKAPENSTNIQRISKTFGIRSGNLRQHFKTFQECPNNIPKHLKTFKCFSTSSFEELQLQPTLRNRLEQDFTISSNSPNCFQIDFKTTPVDDYTDTHKSFTRMFLFYSTRVRCQFVFRIFIMKCGHPRQSARINEKR